MKTEKPNSEFTVTCKEFQKLRHELVEGLGLLKRAITKESKRAPLEEQNLFFYHEGLKQLLELAEKIDSKYLKQGAQNDESVL